MDDQPATTTTELESAQRRILSLEEELSACREKLQGVSGQAAQSAADARAAVDELQYFVYAASHDLQQPLRAVGTHAQLLQRRFADDETAGEFTRVIVEGAAQMNALIVDLLTYSRVGVNLRRETISLNSPLQWSLYTLATMIGNSQAKVTVGTLPDASVDEKQLATVFENLISNAVKFRGDAPPTIHVEAESGEHAITVSVRDNGPGIQPEHLERVFEPFKRLHSREVPGSGLGLSICRKILRAHGGRIWLESDGESGSTAKFLLPLDS